MATGLTEIVGKFWSKSPTSKKYFIANINGESVFVDANDVMVNGDKFFTSPAAIQNAHDRASKMGKGGNSFSKGNSAPVQANVDLTPMIESLGKTEGLLIQILEQLKALNQKTPAQPAGKTK